MSGGGWGEVGAEVAPMLVEGRGARDGGAGVICGRDVHRGMAISYKKCMPLGGQKETIDNVPACCNHHLGLPAIIG